MNKFIQKGLRLFHTVRYLKPIQIYARISFKLYRPKPDISPPPKQRQPLVNWSGLDKSNVEYRPPTSFTFLNEQHHLTFPEGWNNQQIAKLWLYHLHYFDLLQTSTVHTHHAACLNLLMRWIDDNPPPLGNGWESYPISLRVVNWSKWLLTEPEIPSQQLSMIIHSLAVQIRYLYKRIEYHLLGNHLIANAKALVFAGCFFQGDEGCLWLEKGIELLTHELDEQILSDGAHFELSPMYHCIILEDILDLLHLNSCYPSVMPGSLVRQLQDKTRLMLHWLDKVTHPDGEIALFNDAALGFAAHPSALRQYVVRLGISAYRPDSQPHNNLSENPNYQKLETSDITLIADLGEIGASYQPGHAHADTLSFELSVFKQRLIVDPGVSHYGNDKQRLYQRSTAVHNTVLIDDRNSSDVWSGFRVAKRAVPIDVELSTDVNGMVSLKAGHNGYKDQHITHWRQWSLSNGSLSISDQIAGNYEIAVGSLLFAPEVTIQKVEAGSWQLQIPTGQKLRLVTHDKKADLTLSSYHPQFGISLESYKLVFHIMKGSHTCHFYW